MNDERFERSADMRLLEHQRRSMGLLPQERPRWSTRLSASLAHIPVADEAPIERAGAVVSCTLSAHPGAGLIPGAIATITAVLHNDGPAAARGLRVTLPLPAALAYRPGSLLLDGRASDGRATELFESGLMLGEMAGDQRTTILFKATMRAGNDPVVLTPVVAAQGAAVVGARPLELTRASAATAFGRTLAHEIAAPVAPPPAPATASVPLPADDDRPFYELDEEETVAAEALDGALSPIAPLRETPAPLEHLAQAETPAIARIAIPALLVSLPAQKLATMRQFFASERSFGMTAHYLLLTVLATRDGESGATAVTDFLTAQERLLTRALVARKLGKTIALDEVAAPLPPFPLSLWNQTNVPPAATGDIVLYRSFKDGELEFLAAAVRNAATPVFVRAAQLAVGLAPHRSAADSSDLTRRNEELLMDYASAAAAEINRLFVRARLDRKANLFGNASATLDERARALLDALAT